MPRSAIGDGRWSGGTPEAREPDQGRATGKRKDEKRENRRKKKKKKAGTQPNEEPGAKEKEDTEAKGQTTRSKTDTTDETETRTRENETTGVLHPATRLTPETVEIPPFTPRA